MNKLTSVVCGVALVFLAACGSTTTHRVLTGMPGRAHGGAVQIVMMGGTEPKDVREIAIVQASGSGTHADLEHVIQGLTKEAQKLGCEAVIRVKVDQGTNLASASGVCVVFVEQQRTL